MTDSINDINFYKYNPLLAKVKKELEELPTNHQIAFAAYCSESLYKYYIKFIQATRSNESDIVRSSIDFVWAQVKTPHSYEAIHNVLESLEQLDLGEESCCDEWDAAVDAVGTIWLSVESCIGDSANKAARAAGNVINRVYQHLFRQNNVESSDIVDLEELDNIDKKIEEDSLMQNIKIQLFELIKFLKEHDSLTVLDIKEIRSKAKLILE